MATFFGEIGALSSRAVDDEEVEDQPVYHLNIDFKQQSQDKIDCQLLVFSVGKLASAFVTCYLVPDNALHLFDIKCTCEKAPSESIMYTGGLINCSRELKAASVYSVSTDVIVCEITPELPDEINMDLCDLILKEINCSESLLLTSRHISTYKSEESFPETPFLKSLATSEFVANRYCSLSRLQAPNFVSDFPAALMSEFEIKKKAALLVVNFVDNNIMDYLYVQAFERVLRESLIVKLNCISDTKVKLAKYIKAIESRQANLYT